jgi:hypothetical protein
MYMLKKKLLSRSRESMTLPDERYRAVKHAALFLSRLAGGEYPRVPKAVRQEARALLRHYPLEYDMKKTCQTSPDIFQERMEDLHKFVLKGQQQDDSAAEELVQGYREI